jgi:putative SOS response-associated peptidase YedK
MCGKFTAQATWQQVVDFSQPLTSEGGGGDEGGGEGEVYTYRVNGMLPAILWDAELGKRRIVPMRWGFPDRRDWRRPQPIHARAETIDELRTFREAFSDGQRGIVVFETFNEGEEVTKPSGAKVTQQWTVNPGYGRPRGFGFIWRRFELSDLPAPLLACAMVTVPANELIRRTIKAREDDPRMPAILEDFDTWATWLGENDAPPGAVQVLLKTMEGVTWTGAPEPKKPGAPRRR